MGFEKQIDSATWIKLLCNSIVSKSDLTLVIEKANIETSCVDLQSADDAQLLDIECRLFPLKIWDINMQIAI